MADSTQDLEYCGGAEEKKTSNVQFTFEQVMSLGRCRSHLFVRSAGVLYRDLDHDQRWQGNRGPEKIQFYFSERRREIL